MKGRWVTAACFGLLLIGLSCRKKDIRTAMIDIPQMRGLPCRQIVEHTLFRLPGVDRDKSNVDLSRRRAVVVYDSMALSLKNLEHELAKAGFTANDVPGNAEAMAKLPAACRGAQALPIDAEAEHSPAAETGASQAEDSTIAPVADESAD